MTQEQIQAQIEIKVAEKAVADAQYVQLVSQLDNQIAVAQKNKLLAEKRYNAANTLKVAAIAELEAQLTA